MADTPHSSSAKPAGSKWDDSEFHQSGQRPWWLRRRRELLAFLCLLAVTLAVVLWLPKYVAPVQLAVEPGAAEGTTGSNPAGSPGNGARSAGPVEAPWQQAQLAKARRQAQEVLAKLLDRQTALEKMHVQLWADSAYAEALQTAAKGDELYSQRQFPLAQTSYTTALQQLEALVASADDRFQQALQGGQQALQEQQAETAIERFTLATKIRPQDGAAQAGLDRALVLEQVVEQLDNAGNQLVQGDTASARQLVEQALALDPQSEPARALLADIDQRITDDRFAAAMGSGFQHMQKQQFKQAISQFKQALQIKPADKDAREALAAANNQNLQAQIQVALQRASTLEDQEQWQAALETYQQVQALDSSLVAARVGVLRTQARAGLDQRLQQLITEPLRLNDDGVYAQAQALLDDARRVKPQGQRIVAQTRQLQQAIAESQIPVAIHLRSDNQTEVTLYQVGALGSFSEHKVQLKPGQYTVVGSRKGYRDVREEFVVRPDHQALTIVIQCTEKISLDG
ncbi:hypothetical protein G8764_10340 [Pseudomaricurvus alcaniphilus]|uniref:hypothetical protein n=1 Tax=Pseudomaricurvus alcaniphilus TaxID=1166482 RepID=UPI00140DC382|nr:hypothetical protein [Pseudomaricurvus alcaniphilus]NHN37693.1 hypothetical protein [Pseudomaricurvus alcaniphilus]